MVAVPRRDGPEVDQWTDAHVRVGMLKQKLDRRRKAEQRANLQRHAHQQERCCASGEFNRLVQRMLHQAIKPIHPFDAVMDSMQPPKGFNLVARIVCHSDPEIRDQDRHHELSPKRPLARPDIEAMGHRR